MLGTILENAVAGVLLGALFGAGYFGVVYGVGAIKTLWKINQEDT